MSDNPLTERPFFLTRQVANLMEDFAGETSRSSSIFLLYGDALVGKTRVLDELVRRHFSGKRIHRIDFHEDHANEKDSSELAGQIQNLTQNASGEDIIILDHFEAASNTARHQVFQSWATDGLDRKFNLIIVSSSDQFEEIRQLASQYQTQVKSFQLKPFSKDEIEAFVFFYLYPAELTGRLSIPAEIQKQFKNSGGLAGRLIEVLSREGIATAIKQADQESDNHFPIIAAGAILLVLVVVAIFYPLSDQQDQLSPQVTVPEPTMTAEPQKTPAGIDTGELDDQEVEVEQPVSETASVEEPPESEDPETEKSADVEPDIAQESTAVNSEEVSDETPKLPEANLDQNLIVEDNSQNLTRFQQDLVKSLDWINNEDKDSGTVQIMSIGFDTSAEKAYYSYLAKLAKQEIDVSRIRIFQTSASGQVVYSIVYDEYKNRREANNSIQHLPDALKANQPIPRTIGGIRDEINSREQNTL